MSIQDVVSTLKEVPSLLAVKRGLKPRPMDEKDCLGAVVERTAANFGDRPAVISGWETVTWEEFNARANRYAAFLSGAGLRAGDVATLFMENRIEFLAALIGMNKLGVVAGLINTNLRGRQLVHCITATRSKKCIFGGELAAAVGEVRGELGLTDGEDFYAVPEQDEKPPEWSLDMDAMSQQLPGDNPRETGGNTLGQTALYIFTSGTTGLPKAAVMSNRRYLMSAGLAAKAGLRCTPDDRIYVCLPLYHGTALMIGAGASFVSGASLLLRRRFSASAFLPEVREHGCTSFIYVGELCRYLANTPAKPDDHRNPLTTMMGNGLRPDVWLDFKQRFGIERVSEFYGASEGNVAFANLMNKDCTIGMTASKVAVVRYDVDQDAIVRDDDGRCQPVPPGSPGLLLGHINPHAAFEGYTDQDATEAKIVRDAFQQGDAWFNTGDLIREVDVGFTLGYPHYQFVDRIGDTFRWKSENVSTNEVGEIVAGFPAVELCNVYGVEVPGADGRAGMAALRLKGDGELDLAAFADHVRGQLPAFARPVFVRVQSDIEVTGTFKLLKGDLKKEGYDLGQIDDPVYVMKPGSDAYEPLDEDYLAVVRRGEAGF